MQASGKADLDFQILFRGGSADLEIIQLNICHLSDDHYKEINQKRGKTDH